MATGYLFAMVNSSPLESKPVGSLGPVFADDDHNQTDNTSSPTPLMVTQLPTVGPLSASDDVCDTSHNARAPPPLLVSPLQAIRPDDDSNINDSCAVDVDAAPSTTPIKRGRGRPKGSKNSTASAKKPKTYDLNSKVVASCPNFDSKITESERETGNQEIADSVLMRFDAVRRRLCQLGCTKGVLTTALTSCRNLGVRTNMKRRIGPVPGIQVGDIFYFWGEMCLVGLHMQMVAGIDYLTVKDGATEGPLATSVVTSGHYDDETEDLQTLVYTGQGGTDRKGQAFDQKLERGNLALEASKRKGNEIRVIRGEEDPKDKKKKIYIYDGLYTVSDFWKTKGKSGFEEFKFRLVRKPGQPCGYALWKSVGKWWKHGLNNSRKGFVLEDISYGMEIAPVSVVNEIDENDKTSPESFSYITCLNSSNLRPLQNGKPTGCSDCQGRLCSAAEDPKCTCIGRNDGQLPYHNRILVCRKPMVYECGDSCGCLADCKNRVSQTGLKIRVEVFKTEKCGWGLRSWEPIRAGSFICELAGMSTTKEDAGEEDEYVFDSRRVCDRFKWNYEPELVGEDCWENVSEVFNLPSPILISAKRYGNVSRFMNHSCSPNVMWQPIEIQKNGEPPRLHIGFFAIKHIPPLTELRYDYGSSSCVAQEDGQDKRLLKGKNVCYCGSIKCRGSFR